MSEIEIKRGYVWRQKFPFRQLDGSPMDLTDVTVRMVLRTHHARPPLLELVSGAFVYPPLLEFVSSAQQAEPKPLCPDGIGESKQAPSKWPLVEGLTIDVPNGDVYLDVDGEVTKRLPIDDIMMELIVLSSDDELIDYQKIPVVVLPATSRLEAQPDS